jgi:hypothetical protein
VALAPASGRVGVSTVVTATATGYAAGETVQFFFNCAASPCSGSPLGTVVTDAHGDPAGAGAPGSGGGNLPDGGGGPQQPRLRCGVVCGEVTAPPPQRQDAGGRLASAR